MEQLKEEEPVKQRVQVRPQRMAQAQTQAVQIILQIPIHLIIAMIKVAPNNPKSM